MVPSEAVNVCVSVTVSPAIQVLHSGLIQRVGPGAAGEHKTAVVAGASCAGDIGEGRAVIVVDVRDGQGTGGGDHCIADIALGHRSRDTAGDDRLASSLPVIVTVTTLGGAV